MRLVQEERQLLIEKLEVNETSAGNIQKEFEKAFPSQEAPTISQIIEVCRKITNLLQEDCFPGSGNNVDTLEKKILYLVFQIGNERNLTYDSQSSFWIGKLGLKISHWLEFSNLCNPISLINTGVRRRKK